MGHRGGDLEDALLMKTPHQESSLFSEPGQIILSDGIKGIEGRTRIAGYLLWRNLSFRELLLLAQHRPPGLPWQSIRHSLCRPRVLLLQAEFNKIRAWYRIEKSSHFRRLKWPFALSRI